MKVDYQADPVPRLEGETETQVFRICQEALTNIGKHAAARNVTVSLAALPDRARVVVTDDGCGFDTSGVRPTSHGLLGMRFRVEVAGGNLRIDSRPGGGTRIEATLPTLPA